jgi:hypothetical protein
MVREDRWLRVADATAISCREARSRPAPNATLYRINCRLPNISLLSFHEIEWVVTMIAWLAVWEKWFGCIES